MITTRRTYRRSSIGRELIKVGIWLSAVIFIPLGLNKAFNDYHHQGSHYEVLSKPSGWLGHKEYIRYYGADGELIAQEAKEYKGLGHKYTCSSVYRDNDADGDIEVIQEHGAEWKFNALKMYVEQDHKLENPEKFEKGEKLMKELEQNWLKGRNK